MIRRFTVTLEGRNRLHLRQLSEEFVNDLWLPAYLTPEQAADFAADYFRRAVLSELKMLVVRVAEETSAGEAHSESTCL